MKHYLCTAEMDFEAEDEEEAYYLMAAALRQGDVLIFVKEMDD